MIIYILMAFAGYILGRFGHVYLNVWTGNSKWFPHHWIYGVLLIILGIIYWHTLLAQYSLYFGIGLFVSDLKDFLGMKFFEPDKEGPKRFWDID